MQMIPAFLRAGMAAVAAGLGWAGMAAETEAPGPPWAAIREQTFQTVWQTVNDSYFDATFGGVDWAAVGEKYRVKLPDAGDNEALRGLLQGMLGELRRSHFSIMPREMSVFTPEERSRVGTVGVEVAYTEGAVAISELAAESVARSAGLSPGDVIVKIGDQDLAALQAWLEQSDLSPARRGLYLAQLVGSSLRGPVGTSIRVEVRDSRGVGRECTLTFGDHVGEWSEPMGNFPSTPIFVRSHCGADGLAYLHFNVFARLAMKDIRALLRQVPADGGLVIDLRGNLGGIAVMASGISGWLSDRQFQLGTMQLRQGHIGFTVSPQTGAFLGPVAMLIDSNSASTSEIMAAGLQEAGRVRVFGESSPGSALPSVFKALPTGDLLQHAIADMQTPKGVLIEGRGVTPDETVRRTVADLANGRDPVREAAERWLNAERRKAAASPPAPPREGSP